MGEDAERRGADIGLAGPSAVQVRDSETVREELQDGEQEDNLRHPGDKEETGKTP